MKKVPEKLRKGIIKRIFFRGHAGNAKRFQGEQNLEVNYQWNNCLRELTIVRRALLDATHEYTAQHPCHITQY
jgi:hypothetical protein